MKILNVYATIVALAVFAAAVYWVSSFVPHVRQVLKNPHGPDKNLIPSWALWSVFSGFFVCYSSMLLNKYFEYKINRAINRFQFAREWVKSVQKNPKAYQPEERVEAIDSLLVSRLELKRQNVKYLFREVSAELAFIGSILVTCPFWPIMWMFARALCGLER